MSQQVRGTSFNMSHPMQTGWFARGMSQLPTEAAEIIAARYSGSSVDAYRLIETLDLVTSSVTAQRDSEERANLGLLGIEYGSQAEESYLGRIGNKTEIPAQIAWFATSAAVAFNGRRPGYYRHDNPDKITLELGGTRQYGLWTFGGERTSKEVDDATWDLANDLRLGSPVAKIRSYQYEGETPIKYRSFVTPYDQDQEPQFVIGRRRRAVLDVEMLEGQLIHVIKQFRGLIPLSTLSPDYRAILQKEFTQEKMPEIERKATIATINRVVGTIMREAIQNKQYNPLTVCPIDVSLIMTAHKPSTTPTLS